MSRKIHITALATSLRAVSQALLPLPLVIAATVASLPAEASETGQIRGRVLDENGAPMVGVEVTLSGEGLAGEVNQVSGADGQFRFIGVPPGTHDMLLIGADDYAPVRLQIDVRLDEATFVPVTMSKAVTAGEEIVVEEALPVIDATRSAFSASLSDEFLQSLPVGRSYQDAVNMLPGVSGRIDTQNGGASNGNPSVRGEGQYGNNFLVDGISTRDPATKTFGTDVNFDAIQDIQVYTDGAPAEFGQFAGMLVNVVTKDGGDEHHGTVGYWLGTDASAGTYPILDREQHIEVPTRKRDFVNHELSATAGGPIVKEKLWYFSALSLNNASSVFEGGDPDKPRIANDGSLLAKISWFATPDVTLRYAFNGSLLNINNYETEGVTAESQARRIQTGFTHLFTAAWRPDALTEFELKGGQNSSTLDHIPMSGDHDTSAVVNMDTSVIERNHTDFDLNVRSRLGGGLAITRVLENVAGDHKFKVGAEYWLAKDERDLQFTGNHKYYSLPSAGLNCTAPDYLDCSQWYEYDDVGALPHRGNQFAAFIQDDWSPFRVLTLNVGVRLDRESLFQNEGNPVYMDNIDTERVEQIPYRMNMPAPRLGLSWDITGDSKTLLSVNGGRYYDVAGNTFADWADTKSAFGYRQYGRDEDGDCLDIVGDGAGDFDPLGSPYCLVWEQDPTGNPLVYDSKLKPAHLDKYTVQFKRELFPLFSVGVRGIMSRTIGLPEDEDTDLNVWYITNPDIKRRDYKALEIVADKKYDDVWQLMASYTLSSAKGTNPGQFELASGGDFGSDGNNVGVFLDQVNYYTPEDHPNRPEGTLDQKFYIDNGLGFLIDGLTGLGTVKDDQGWYGYLPYHSFHAVKINGSYTLPEGTTFGLVYEYDSGHAYQKRTWVDLYGDYMGFGEGRGTRFMPSVHYIDVRAAHEFDLPRDRALELTLDCFNIMDFKKAINYWENDDANFGLTYYRQAPRSIRAGMKVTY